MSAGSDPCRAASRRLLSYGPDEPQAVAAVRVLVVEDNLLIAETIAEVLHKAGAEIVGPAPDLQQGVALAQAARIDGAVLDIKLADGHCFAIATILRLRGIPFVFLSGYRGADLVPDVFQSILRLQKPGGIWDLPLVIEQTFAAH